MVTLPDPIETYFSKSEHIFPSINVDNSIPTEPFLKACNGIANFVGFLGTAFTPVRHDIAGNIRKLRLKFNSNRESCQTLQSLVEFDLKKNNGKMGKATDALLWLKRGLEFMLEFLSHMVADYSDSEEKARNENLTSTVKNAYNITLKWHHNFLSRHLFKVISEYSSIIMLVIHTVPYRKDILNAMVFGREGQEDLCIEHISHHLTNFRANVNSLVHFFYSKELEQPSVSE